MKEALTVDRLVASMGARKAAELTAIANNLRDRFSDSYVEELFSTEQQETLDRYVGQNSEALQSGLQQVYAILQAAVSTKFPGHEMAHIIDNVNAALRIFGEYEKSGAPLTEGQKFEIVAADLFHDLGRFAEPVFGDKIDKKLLAVVVPAMVGNQIQRSIGRLPQALNMRVLYDIDSNTKPVTGRRTADIVHQCDREQLAGPDTFFRDLAYDFGVNGRRLGMVPNGKTRTALPFPDSADDTHVLRQMEFYMRNVYPPVSPEGVAVSDRNKKENAVILLLGLQGKPQEMYEQVFGPELGMVRQGEEGVHWTKRPIPDAVFQDAKEEMVQFSRDIKKQGLYYTDGKTELVSLVRSAMEIEKLVEPENFTQNLTAQLSSLDAQDRENFWMITQYSLLKRHQRRKEDLARLHGLAGEQSNLEKLYKSWVIAELTDRERIFLGRFPSAAI